MRQINHKSRQYYRNISRLLRGHFRQSLETANATCDPAHIGDLFLVNQLGIGLIDELLRWGYQEKSLNPTFNRWQPDTCDCSIFYHFDPCSPQGERILTASHFAPVWHDDFLEVGQREPCTHHQILDVHVHYAVVLGENQLKNRSLKAAFEAIPAQFKEDFVEEVLISADGRKRTRWISAKRISQSDPRPRISWFKQGYEPQWSFDESRRLIITLAAFPQKTSKQISRSIEEQFGDALRVTISA